MTPDPRIRDLHQLTDDEIAAYQPPLAAWSRDARGRLHRIVFAFEGEAMRDAVMAVETAQGRRVIQPPHPRSSLPRAAREAETGGGGKQTGQGVRG